MSVYGPDVMKLVSFTRLNMLLYIFNVNTTKRHQRRKIIWAVLLQNRLPKLRESTCNTAGQSTGGGYAWGRYPTMTQSPSCLRRDGDRRHSAAGTLNTSYHSQPRDASRKAYQICMRSEARWMPKITSKRRQMFRLVHRRSSDVGYEITSGGFR